MMTTTDLRTPKNQKQHCMLCRGAELGKHVFLSVIFICTTFFTDDDLLD